MASTVETDPRPAPGVLAGVGCASERRTPSWNPLSVAGTALPPQLLLAVKLIAVSFVLTGQLQLLPQPYVPFLPLLEGLPLRPVLQGTFLAAAVALLFNRAVRPACIAMALTLFTGVLASRLYFENNRVFTGCVLLLAGLYEPRQRRSLIAYQLVVLYFGAALNKALDPDWRSGRFFENWAVNVLDYPWYAQLSAALPPLLLSAALCWLAISLEAVLAVGFLVRRLYPAAIALGILWHTGLMLLTGRTFGMFYYALLSAYVSLVQWPRAPVVLVHGQEGRVRSRLRGLLQRLDFDRTFRWVPEREAGGRGVGARRTGAYAAALRYLPATYFTLALLFMSLRPLARLYRGILASVH